MICKKLELVVIPIKDPSGLQVTVFGEFVKLYSPNEIDCSISIIKSSPFSEHEQMTLQAIGLKLIKLTLSL